MSKLDYNEEEGWVSGQGTRLGYSRAAGDCGVGTTWWGEGIQHRKLAGLCGVAGWAVESGEARLQSLARGDEI